MVNGPYKSFGRHNCSCRLLAYQSLHCLYLIYINSYISILYQLHTLKRVKELGQLRRKPCGLKCTEAASIKLKLSGMLEKRPPFPIPLSPFFLIKTCKKFIHIVKINRNRPLTPSPKNQNYHSEQVPTGGLSLGEPDTENLLTCS